MSDYDDNAAQVLNEAGGSMTITLSDTKLPPWAEDGRYRPHYRVALKGPGGTYRFDYWASIKDGEEGKQPTAYDVLACLEWNTPDDFDDFCADFGYDTDSRKALRAFRECSVMTRALHRIFPDQAARDALAEVR